MPVIKSPKKSRANDDSDMVASMPKEGMAMAYSAQKAAKKKKMALGGAVEGATQSKSYTRNPGTPAPKPDDRKIPESESMSKNWSEGSAPARKPDNSRPPESQYMAGHFAEGGPVDHKKMYTHHMDMARHYMRGGDISQADTHYKMANDHRTLAGSTAVSPHEAKSEAGYSDDEMGGKFAQGGEIPAPKTESMSKGGYVGPDNSRSVAEAIMKRRKMYADGGEVDLEQNATESENTMDELNMDALGKESYSESDALIDFDQPQDSNEKGDDIPADQHSMIGKLRARIKSRRGF